VDEKAPGRLSLVLRVLVGCWMLLLCCAADGVEQGSTFAATEGHKPRSLSLFRSAVFLNVAAQQVGTILREAAS